ncbi:unnamed protein product [Cylicostephanus goldi]|uniref:Uncharacterized protein n=1 Tax=Cylicostephanus goldi TaxID=71465 RepID=A0A3P6S943_CYLGO|nr:unnamed protein product [Cylicostephanus goldi]
MAEKDDNLSRVPTLRRLLQWLHMTSAIRSSSSLSSRRTLSALATCTSLSQAINSIDNSKPAVILDLGRRTTK